MYKLIFCIKIGCDFCIMSSKYTCPHCGSENTMSVSMAYKSGHVTGYATGREIVGYTDVKVKVTVHSDGSTSKKTSGGDAIYDARVIS